MLPFIIPAVQTALSLIPEIGKLGLASRQRKQADELAKIKRPAYDIPDAAEEALTRARYRALASTLPGQSLMEQKINSATATGQRFATETAASPIDALATASAMTANQQNALGDLSVQAANYHDQNQQLLTNQLGSFATWQDKANQWNKYQPYMEAKQAESALRYGTEANKYSGWKGILGSLSAGVTSAAQAGAFDGSGATKTKSPLSSYIPLAPALNKTIQVAPMNQSTYSPDLTKTNMFAPTVNPTNHADIYSMVQRLKMLPQYAGMSDSDIGNIVMQQLGQ